MRAAALDPRPGTGSRSSCSRDRRRTRPRSARTRGSPRARSGSRSRSGTGRGCRPQPCSSSRSQPSRAPRRRRRRDRAARDCRRCCSPPRRRRSPPRSPSWAGPWPSSFVHDHPTKVQFVVDPCGPNNQTGRTRRHDCMADATTIRRYGAIAWLCLACVLALLMAGLAYCMLSPVRWDGAGKFGALALFFPLHLLVFTFVAAVLTFLARRSGAGHAAWVFILVMIVTVVMALTPAIAVWRQARELGVPLSLGDYLVNAGQPNVGPPQRERSVVYGTAKDGAKLELDVWRTGKPNSGPLRPAVVYVHGGGWTHGHRSSTPAWDRWLNELGYEVFDVEYRKPPPVRWLDEIGDVKAALGWVVAHAADYHVDITRISLMGGSP